MNKKNFFVLCLMMFLFLNLVFLAVNISLNKVADTNIKNNIGSFKSNNNIYKYRADYRKENNDTSSGEEVVLDYEDLNIRIWLKSFDDPRVEIVSKDGVDGLYSSVDIFDGEVLRQRINLHDSSKISWDESNSDFYKGFFAFDDRSNTLFSIPDLPVENVNLSYPTGLEYGVYFAPLNLDKIYDPYLIGGKLSYRLALNNKGPWFKEVDSDCVQYRDNNNYRFADSDLIEDVISYLDSVEYHVYELGGHLHEIYTADYLNELKGRLALNDFSDRIHGVCNFGEGKDLVIVSNADGDRKMSLLDASGEKVLASQNVFENNESLEIPLYGSELFDDAGKTSCFIEDIKEESFIWVCSYPQFSASFFNSSFKGEYEYYEIDFDGNLIDKYIVGDDEM